jgi:minor extracellular serine protease Vpr
MKNFLVLIWSFAAFLSSAQVQIPANTRADVGLIIKDALLNKGIPSAVIKERFAVYALDGGQYVSFIGKTAPGYTKSSLAQYGIIVGAQVSDIVSLKIPVSLLSNIASLPGLSVLQLSGKIKPNLDKAVKDVGADSVHFGINLPERYTGKNVFIGITDWGFDYSSPMFYDTLIQNTRIYAAWDQYKTSGPAPLGFSYGTEYTSLPEFVSAGADTANIYSYATHGSHVAGIAGGGGAGTIFRGVAYESQFLFATFLVDEGAVLDAWEWMYQKAQLESKRLVINMSWGLYHIGTLDGNSLLSQAIDAYSALGVIFSNSGGNNGSVNFHIKKQFNNDSIKSRIEFYSYASNPNMWGQSIHMWGEQGNDFEAGIKLYNSTGSTMLVESPYFSTSNTLTYVDTFLVTGIDTVWYNISADAVHPENGRPQIRLRVKNTNSTLRVVLKAKAVSGLVHFWNVTELSTDVGNWGMPFSTINSGTIGGDNQYGISEPSCTNSLLSVAAFASKYYAPNGAPIGGGIASFSSIGPRYDGVLKPEIAAPGVSVGSSISSYTDNGYTSIASVDFNGRVYPFARFSGTSMAAPMVTGVIALILDANPYLSAAQVKEIIIQTAREDNNTGVIPVNGSIQWGWGKVDAYNAVKLALSTVGTQEIDAELSWSVYPNPVLNELHFTLVDELPSKVEIVDAIGRVTIKNVQGSKVSVSDLKPGTYWVRLEMKGHIEQQAFIKQ